tara:strand:- start:435 stop:1457 length:1023 start_codon:yes stop_codon:yes gene_type:complete
VNGLLRQFRWGTAQAGISLSLASSAWLLSGLTASPLINSLLPAFTTLPALLPLQRRAGGFLLALMSALLLLLLCSPVAEPLTSSLIISGVLISVLVLALGQDLSQLPLQRQLLSNSRMSFGQLRRGSELGALAGFGLTGLLGVGWHQFMPAALLLLPLLPMAIQARRSSGQQLESIPTFHAGAALQGLVFSGLFALLPLWVRSISAGNCFNFGMVLMAFGIGRSLIASPPRQSPWRLYVLIAVLLLASQWLPGWITTALFIAIGALAAGLDHLLVGRIAPQDQAFGWQVMRRSGAIGGLVGILVMGSVAQVIGLNAALLLQIALFIAAPFLLQRLCTTEA